MQGGSYIYLPGLVFKVLVTQPVWSEYIYQAFKDAEIGQVAYVLDAGHKELIIPMGSCAR